MNSKLIICLLAAVLLLFPGEVAAEEARGLWIVRDQLTSRENIEEVVNNAVENNFNMLIVQVSGRGDAYYQSDILPKAAALSEQPTDFDPLHEVIDKASEYENLSVHAWINSLLVSPFGIENQAGHIVNTNPEWLTYHYEDIRFDELDSDQIAREVPGLFLEPGLPEVQEHIANIFAEVAENYDVDGVHHDFIRMPNTNYGFHPQIRSEFMMEYAVDPLLLRQERSRMREEMGRERYNEIRDKWDQVRRDNISSVVEKVYTEVKGVDPAIEVSGAVYDNYNDAYDDVLQDWKEWLKEGHIDFAVPMIYHTNLMTANWMTSQGLEIEKETGRTVVPGLGAYMLTEDQETLLEMVEHAREEGAKGVVFFSYSSIRDSEGYFDLIREELFPQPTEYPENF